MVWDGYLEFGGVPIINGEATEAYLANLAPGMPLRPRFQTEQIHLANEEEAYRSPLLDEQPWANPNDPATHGFYGLYPLAIEGLDGSTLTAAITEYLSDGGSVGLQRNTTRSVRVSGLLVGQNMLSAQAGLSWLSAALASTNDGCATCEGGELRYFLVEPEVCENVFGAVDRYDRRQFGGLGVGTLRYRWLPADGVPVAMPSVARWDGAFEEGTTFIWGAVPIGSTTVLESNGPVAPTRRNYIANPSFRAGASGWSLNSTALTGTWVPSGGADGDGYLAIAPVATVVAPVLSRFGEGKFGDGRFDGAASPGGIPRPWGSDTFGSGLYGVANPPSGITVSSAEPMAAGPIAFSVALRSTEGAQVRVTMREQTNGAIIGSNVVTATGDWTRYPINATLAGSDAVLVEFASTTAFDIDQALLEISTSQLGYFDGNTVQEDYVNQWEGITDYSISSMRWQKSATIERPDSNYRPFIEILCGSTPTLDLVWEVRPEITVPEQLVPVERRLYDVEASTGPAVIANHDFGGRGAFIQVEFTLTAGNPATYSLPIEIDTTPLASGSYVDPDAVIALESASWLADPNVLAVTLPPSAPVIINPAIENIRTWTRYYVPIPASAVSDWNASIPTVGVVSGASPVTQVRFRFHPNPFNYAVDDVDPLAFCSEFIVSYLPAVTRLEVDGVTQRATATRGGSPALSADHLLYGANGAPITWPELSCGVPHVLTIDIPPTSSPDAFAVDLVVRQKAA